MSSAERRTTAKSKAEPKTPSPEPETEARPEPLPEWDVAINTWSEFWEIHYVGFGCTFAVMALFSCFCLYRIHSAGKAMILRRYFFAVCLMMMLFCFSRSLYLLLDPYESHSVLTLPVILVRILFALGYPCLTSAFSLIHFAFIEVKKIRTIVNRLQNIKFLSSVILLHFLIVMVIYIVITFAPNFARLLIFCQSILISWWITLAICFLYSGFQVSWEAKISKQFFVKQKSKRKEASNINQKTSYAPMMSSETCDHAASQLNPTYYRPEPSDGRKAKGVSKIARISGVVVVLGLVMAALELYSLFAVYDLYSSSKTYVDAWPWWAYETCVRVIEFLLCLVIAYVIFPSLKTKTNEHKSTSNSTCMTRNAANRQSKLSIDALDVVVTIPERKNDPKAESKAFRAAQINN